jgi:N-acetylglucosamine-6-phosphate deacetylase
MTVLSNARIVRPDGVLEGWLRVAGGRIVEIGPGAPGRGTAPEAPTPPAPTPAAPAPALPGSPAVANGQAAANGRGATDPPAATDPQVTAPGRGGLEGRGTAEGRGAAQGRRAAEGRAAEGRAAKGRSEVEARRPAESAATPEATEYDLGGSLVVPGFVDMHVHGGAGGAYPSGDHEEARRAQAYHLDRGTTTTVASLVTAGLADMTRAVASLAELCEAGLLAGIHLEGPYLARSRCGAHQPELLREPDRAELAALLDAGRGHVRMVTVAPELRGGARGRTSGIDLVRDIVAWGAIAAIGHTEATYDEARAAIDAGARVATHLFNAMPPLGHREPGPVGAALEDDEVIVELINDGVHVSASVARVTFAAAAGRIALITDAMPAAGLGDGDYRLGPIEVTVTDGRATVTGGSSIAGSTIVMADALRRAVGVLGLPVEVAAVASSLTPARALGLADEIGSLEPGKRADLVVLDEELEPEAVMQAGTWIREPGA